MEHQAESTPKEGSRYPRRTLCLRRMMSRKAEDKTRAVGSPRGTETRLTAHGGRFPYGANHGKRHTCPLVSRRFWASCFCGAAWPRTVGWICSSTDGTFQPRTFLPSLIRPGLRFLLAAEAASGAAGANPAGQDSSCRPQLPRPRIGCHMNFSVPQQTKGAEEGEGLRAMQDEVPQRGGGLRCQPYSLSNCSGGRSFFSVRFGLMKGSRAWAAGRAGNQPKVRKRRRRFAYWPHKVAMSCRMTSETNAADLNNVALLVGRP